MGDRRRFDLLAEFVAHNFPKSSTVADVAGGMGYLSLALNERGYRPTVIDPRHSNLRRRDRCRVRPRWQRWVREFTPYMAEQFDVLVGLHPDGATESLVRSAVVRPVVIVPCCFYWKGIESHGVKKNVADVIRRVWRHMNVRWNEDQLPMNGKNLVLWTTGRR